MPQVTPDAPTRCPNCNARMRWNGKEWEHEPQPPITLSSSPTRGDDAFA